MESKPSEIFHDVLPVEIIDIMVRETNRYADQYFRGKGGVGNLKLHARAKKWRPVDREDMTAFIGIILYMGMARLPTYALYWSNNWLLDLGLKQVISRDRFLNILTFLHCADNEAAPPRDSAQYNRLYKVQEVVDTAIGSWQRCYYPKREMSTDETIVPFSGTSSLKGYNPNKPHKWGITIWCLADARAGYVYNWNIHRGKSTGNDPRTQNNDGRGAIHWVTWDLLESADVLNKGHHLYCDNYFSSKTLFDDLVEENTGACGTLRRNRIGTPATGQQIANSSSPPPIVLLRSFFRNLATPLF